MFKYIYTAIFALVAFFLSFFPAFAEENKTDIYFFYGDGCPHCAKEEMFLDKLEKENLNLEIHRFEVWKNDKNSRFLSDLSKAYGWNVTGVPLTVIGGETIVGYWNEETTGQEIVKAIENHLGTGSRDLVGEFLENGTETKAPGRAADKGERSINMPVFGRVDLKDVSLPLLTIMIAAVDGLNPCALWVLVFLISMLVSLQQRRKLLILGSAFIIASAALYYFVLAAWLNFLLFVGFMKWLQVIIGLAAIYSGYYYIKKWLDQDKTCHSVDEMERKKIFTKVKEVIARDKIWLALIGIVVVAFSVNLFKLLCSAGLPAIYTQVLTLSGLPKWQYYAYLLLYVAVFQIYEIVILGVALSTFKMKAINPKFILRIGLVGGIVMLVIGILMLFRPDVLMFG